MIPEKTVINNTIFCLFDVAESLMIDAERLYKIDGQEIKHQSKQDFKKALFHTRRFLSSLRDCSNETIMQFGEDADEFKELIMLYVDRANDNATRSELFMNYLRNCSSLLGFNFKKIGL